MTNSPNSFLTANTPAEVAKVAATLVAGDLNIANTLNRDVEADFREGSGNIVHIRVPGAVEAFSKDANDITTPLERGKVNEQFIPVQLDTHAYSNVPLSEADLSLNIQDFASQVLVPQCDALVADIERRSLAALQSTPVTELAYDSEKPQRTFTQIRATLRNRKVSADTPITAIVGIDVMSDLLDAETALVDDKVRGITVIESSRLANDEIVAYVPQAFTLVVRAPSVPKGSSFGASVKHKNMGLRWLKNYLGDVAADMSLVSTLIAVTPTPLAVVDEEAGKVDLVEHGGAVRLLTAGDITP